MQISNRVRVRDRRLSVLLQTPPSRPTCRWTGCLPTKHVCHRHERTPSCVETDERTWSWLTHNPQQAVRCRYTIFTCTSSTLSCLPRTSSSISGKSSAFFAYNRSSSSSGASTSSMLRRRQSQVQRLRGSVPTRELPTRPTQSPDTTARRAIRREIRIVVRLRRGADGERSRGREDPSQR